MSELALKNVGMRYGDTVDGALVLAGMIAMVMMGIPGAWVIGCAAGITVAATALARWKIGGHTGDTLGATQMLVETFTLLAALQFLA